MDLAFRLAGIWGIGYFLGIMFVIFPFFLQELLHLEERLGNVNQGASQDTIEQNTLPHKYKKVSANWDTIEQNMLPHKYKKVSANWDTIEQNTLPHKYKKVSATWDTKEQNA